MNHATTATPASPTYDGEVRICCMTWDNRKKPEVPSTLSDVKRTIPQITEDLRHRRIRTYRIDPPVDKYSGRDVFFKLGSCPPMDDEALKRLRSFISETLLNRHAFVFQRT